MNKKREIPIYDEKKMSGGGNRIIPSYEPTIAEDDEKKNFEKKPFSKNFEEKKPLPSQKKNNDQLLVDLQVFNPQSKKPSDPIKSKMSKMPMLPIAYTTPYVPPQFQNYMQEEFQKYSQPFIYKDYNINIGGLNSNHIMAQKVFEDILPPDDIYSSFKSLRERNVLCSYIRSTFINTEDGEHRDFSGGENSLNSRLKLIQLTPFTPHNLTNNKYKNRPKNMLMYSSCYPIKYNEKTRNCDCADKHIIMNVRVYNLSNEEYTYFNQNNLKSGTLSMKDVEKNSNIIRELLYFRFVRQMINEEKYCPNFVESYCYFVAKDCNINFNNEQIKEFDNSKCSNNKEKSQMCLIILTEGPDYNIYSWGSNKSKMDRNLVKQISSGYKTNEMWDFVLFQIIIVFYTMWEKNFTFEDMNLNNNFYIKVISSVSSSSDNFYKYVVNGIEYYLINTGYLLMCNTDNHDITDGSVCKILSNEFKDDIEKIKKIILLNAKRCLAIDSFREKDFVKPPLEMENKIQDINKILNNTIVPDIGTNIFEDILLSKFLNFLNNRIGTELKMEERKLIISDIFNPKKGDLCVKEENEIWKICMFIKRTSDGNGLFIINKNQKPMDLPMNLFYSINSNVNQDIPYFTSDNLIETYYL